LKIEILQSIRILNYDTTNSLIELMVFYSITMMFFYIIVEVKEELRYIPDKPKEWYLKQLL